MAINVDSVYKTVLLILNQQQRGYITPDEFNKISTQVQLSIFEGYMGDQNQQLRLVQSDHEYANRTKNIEEKIDIFKEIELANYNPSGGYYMVPTTPTLNSAPTENFGPVDSTGIPTYNVGWPTTSNFNAQIEVTINGVVQSDYSFNGSSFTFSTATTPAAGPANQVQAVLRSSGFYRLGTVVYNDITEIQQVERNEWYLLKKAPLMQPTNSYPLFLRENDKIFVMPTTTSTNPNTSIKISYLRRPADVKWSFTTGSLGQYLYDSGTSIQFELHPSEQTEVILQVLTYAGVILKDPAIVQTAMQKIQQEEVNQKS